MFEILEHPSDAGVLARASTREEALIEASTGLCSIIFNRDGLAHTEERTLHAPGHDEASQIVNWMNEILFFFDTESFAPVEFTIDSWTDKEITGRARGAFFDFSKNEFRTAVKACTFHQFESHATPEGWEIRVFVDV
jgi:SHS2 domain-containing protein